MQGRPIVTYLLLGLIFTVYVLVEFTGGSTHTANLLRWGALAEAQVRAGEYWRLVTPLFLHIGILHLMFNSYALFQLGTMCEALYGSARFLLIFVVCGVGGSVLSILCNDDAVSAGASGAIFGLAGLLLTAALTKHAAIHDTARRALIRGMAPFVAYNLIFGFIVPGIDNFGHLGGLITGAALGTLITPRTSATVVRFLSVVFATTTLVWAAHAQWQVGRDIHPEQIDADVQFFLEAHTRIVSLMQRFDEARAADVPNPEAFASIEEGFHALQQEGRVHFVSPELADAHKTFVGLTDAIAKNITQVRLTLMSLLDASGTSRAMDEEQLIGEHGSQMSATFRALERNMQEFAAWSERMVAWSAAHGYVLRQTQLSRDEGAHP